MHCVCLLLRLWPGHPHKISENDNPCSIFKICRCYQNADFWHWPLLLYKRKSLWLYFTFTDTSMKLIVSSYLGLWDIASYHKVLSSFGSDLTWLPPVHGRPEGLALTFYQFKLFASQLLHHTFFILVKLLCFSQTFHSRIHQFVSLLFYPKISQTVFILEESGSWIYCQKYQISVQVHIFDQFSDTPASYKGMAGSQSERVFKAGEDLRVWKMVIE